MLDNYGFCKISNVFNIHPYCDDEQLYQGLSLSVDMEFIENDLIVCVIDMN